MKLQDSGLELKAGQSVSYVITKYKTKGMNRAVPEELAENTEYDSSRYVELLLIAARRCCLPLVSARRCC